MRMPSAHHACFASYIGDSSNAVRTAVQVQAGIIPLLLPSTLFATGEQAKILWGWYDIVLLSNSYVPASKIQQVVHSIEYHMTT